MPKALHKLAGKELLVWAEAACRDATGRAPVVVIGPEMQGARELLPADVTLVIQRERLGTGHALLQARDALRTAGETLLVATADMALLTAATLRSVVETQQANAGPLTMLTVVAGEARGFGRVVRDDRGAIARIVEEREATPEEKRITELNASVYAYRADWLWDHLPRIVPSSNGELYLTDLVGMAAAEGLSIAGVPATDP
ncbi:MAG TPA: NTP transferase domain-containing protein, partial [Anaerolineales bacterium]|nr:NTP transferase domain-containing protein [Anaerolineales bacterium]